VSVALPKRPWLGDDPLDELRGLATTAGAQVVGGVLQKRDGIVPGTYIGKGKLEELKESVESNDADVVIFDNDLSPAQVHTLENATGPKLPPATTLTQHISARGAQNMQPPLQAKLAHPKPPPPRLRRMWTHLSRYKGGIGLRGPGETQLEEDRRLVALKIRDLKKRLGEGQARKEREVKNRFEGYTSALLGITNACKSTPMKYLTRDSLH